MLELCNKNTLSFVDVIKLANFYNVPMSSLTEDNHKNLLNNAINKKYKKILNDFEVGKHYLIVYNSDNRNELVKLTKIDMGCLYFGKNGWENAIQCPFHSDFRNKPKSQDVFPRQFISIECVKPIPEEAIIELQDNYLYPNGLDLNLHNVCQGISYSLKKNMFLKPIRLKDIIVENGKVIYHFQDIATKKIVKHTLKDFTLRVHLMNIVKHGQHNKQNYEHYFRLFRPVVEVHNHTKKIDELYVYDDTNSFVFLQNIKLNKEETEYIAKNLTSCSKMYFDITEFNLNNFLTYTKKDFSAHIIEDGKAYIGDEWYFVNHHDLSIGKEKLTKRLFQSVGFRSYSYFKLKKNAQLFSDKLKKQRK